MKALLLHRLLDRAAERTPDSDAVRCSGQSLTYRELADRASRLARVLLEQGVGSGDRVAIYMGKSLEAVVAIYGAMKAGAAYVPIDPLAPASRVAYIVNDCDIRCVVSNNERISRLEKLAAGAGGLECLIGVEASEGLRPACIPWQQVWAAPSAPDIQPEGAEHDLAYILYTSGSTGRPKGVMHTHRSALSFVNWAVEAFAVAPEDRLSNHAPIHFDLSTFDLFGAAAAGATTVVVPEDIAKFPANVADLISEERISIWYSVPFALVQLVQRGALTARDLSSLRCVLFAGEPFPPRRLHELMRLLPAAEFYNLYGPTETNVCTFHPVPHSAAEFPAAAEPIPIGRACAGAELIVANSKGRPVARGEPGELLVRAPTVMAGYWRRPERTAKAFYRSASGEELANGFYRTGDSVRQELNGDYLFLGRKDRQIKLRGFRIELDEIEVALLAHPQVEQAAAYLVSRGDESQCIAASVAQRPGNSVTVRGLRRHLIETLPAYAVPEHILLTERFPRTSTGKIDRQELSASFEGLLPEEGLRTRSIRRSP